jgi:hypothetical protein
VFSLLSRTAAHIPTDIFSLTGLSDTFDHLDHLDRLHYLSAIPETSPTAQVSHTLVICFPVLRAILQPLPSSALASTLTFPHTVSIQPAPDATSSAHSSSTNSSVGGVSGGIITGGIPAAVVCIVVIVSALLYSWVGSIYTLFCTMSYDIIRESLAV